jgi:hypothetical protein
MFSTSYTVLNSYTNYNIQQVFFTIIYLKEFVLAVVVVLPSYIGLRRISSPRTKLLAARCECMHEHFHPITMLNS